MPVVTRVTVVVEIVGAVMVAGMHKGPANKPLERTGCAGRSAPIR